MSGSGLVAIVVLAVALATAAAAADHRAARRAAVNGGFGSRAVAAASQSESSVVGSERFEVLERDAVGDGSIESADVAIGEGSGGGVVVGGGGRGGDEAWGERGGDLKWQPSARKSSSPIESAVVPARKCECGSAIAAAMTAAARRTSGAAAVTAAALAETGTSTGEVREAAVSGREPVNVVLSRYRTWLVQGGSAGIAIARKFSNVPTPSVEATTSAVAAADTREAVAHTARAEMAAVAAERAETMASETAAKTAAAATTVMSTISAMPTTSETKTNPAASTASSLDIVASSASCPPGFYTLRGWNHCYLLSTFKTTRALAREYCYSMGAGVELLTIDSTQEHHLVAYLIQQTGASQEADGWWTAGMSLGYSGWVWRLRVRLVKLHFFMWNPAAGGDGGSGQPDWGKCLILQKSSSYFWSSDRCSDETTVLSGVARHNFVCKAPLATPKPCS